MIISAYLQVSGLLDVGYQFYNGNETANGSRITAGIVGAGDGWYSADATFPSGISSVRWNSSGQPQLVAREYFGVTVDNNAIAAAVWQVLTSSLTLAGSVGKLVADNVNATISSRSTYAGVDTSGTTTLLSRIASALTITAGKVDVNDKTGFSLTAAYDPAKTSAQAGAPVTVSVNNDKTGYTLTSAYDAAKNAAQAGPVTVSVNNDKTGYTITAAQVLAIVDQTLGRDWTLVTGEADESLLQAMRSMRNKWTIDASGVLKVYREDGVTIAWQRNVLSTADANPIVGLQ